jgi:ABC-type Fe3+-hydroxamate transport system substrate-binding protein
MKKWSSLAMVLSLAILLAACGNAASSEGDIGSTPAPNQAAGTPEPQAVASSGSLTEDYEDALSLRNQLAFGILQLGDTPNAVTAEQAVKLLTLWQALKVLGESSTTAPEEMEAVQNQIAATLEPAQIASLAALQLTNADLQAYYVEIGVSEVRTPEPGVTPQSGSFKDLPQEQREAARATAEALGTPVGGGSGGSSKRDALLENVIELLATRTGES